jgi:hypothetical protein
MGAVSTFEPSVHFYRTVGSDIQEGSHLHYIHLENVKFHTENMLLLLGEIWSSHDSLCLDGCGLGSCGEINSNGASRQL